MSSTIFMRHEYTSPAQSIALPSLLSPASSPSGSSSTGSDSSSSEHIKRPCNAFMIYRSAFLQDKKVPATETIHQQTLSRVIGQAWRAMPDDEKAFYNQAATAASLEHHRRYPNYKFSPGAGKLKAKAKKEKKISKVSAEEVTRMRMQYTNVKGPVLSGPKRGAKKARSVKANARAPASTAYESAFEPVLEAVPETTGFADSFLHAPLRLPSGPSGFEQYAPQAAEAMQYGAQACSFNANDYTQSMMSAPQYADNPTFRNESHHNHAMWNPTPAVQYTQQIVEPMPYYPPQPPPFYNEQIPAYNFPNAFDMQSSSAIPPPTNYHDCNTIGASPDGTVPFDDNLSEEIAGLCKDDELDIFIKHFAAYNPFL